MKQTLGMLSPEGPTEEQSALDQAQDLIYDAWEMERPENRIRLAKQALKLSDLCADAHVILAEEGSGTYEDMLSRYEVGVAAGERAIGKEIFENGVGYFWGILETRPYMRARAGLGACLWRIGEDAKAIAHYQDLLRLNPNDNQGLRYFLTGWLYATGDLDALGRLLKDYEEEYSAEWAYATTLLAFAKGDQEKAHSALKAAWECNPHVPALLCGTTPMPKSLPDWYSPGAPDEAALYADRNQEGWSATKGALQWLEESVRHFKPSKKKGTGSQGSFS